MEFHPVNASSKSTDVNLSTFKEKIVSKELTNSPSLEAIVKTNNLGELLRLADQIRGSRNRLNVINTTVEESHFHKINEIQKYFVQAEIVNKRVIFKKLPAAVDDLTKFHTNLDMKKTLIDIRIQKLHPEMLKEAGINTDELEIEDNEFGINHLGVMNNEEIANFDKEIEKFHTAIIELQLIINQNPQGPKDEETSETKKVDFKNMTGKTTPNTKNESSEDKKNSMPQNAQRTTVVAYKEFELEFQFALDNANAIKKMIQEGEKRDEQEKKVEQKFVAKQFVNFEDHKITHIHQDLLKQNKEPPRAAPAA